LQGVQELAAGLLADPAVLMVAGVPLALVAAALADGHAGLQQRPGDVGVVGRLAACHPMVAVQASAQSRHSRMHVTISVTFCSLKSVLG
jgi:hypothetical protein